MAVTRPHIRDGRPVGLLVRACLTTTACLVGLVLMATGPWNVGGAVILETVIVNSLWDAIQTRSTRASPEVQVSKAVAFSNSAVRKGSAVEKPGLSLCASDS